MRGNGLLQIYEHRERVKRSGVDHRQLSAVFGTQFSGVQVTQGKFVHLQSPSGEPDDMADWKRSDKSVFVRVLDPEKRHYLSS